MLFNSWQYAVFLPIVFVLYWALPHKYRWPLLLIASYYFYMSWNAKYVILIFFTTLISYLAAIGLEKTDSATKKKTILAAALAVCLGLLFIFKYFNFFTDSLNALFAFFALPLQAPTLNLLLPVGISFYTFQTISYVVDVYRGSSKAEHHFGIYATFISFFPQLVAGPIERTGNLLPQIKEEHFFNYDTAMTGLKLMAVGYFKKLVVADNLAVIVDQVYNNLESYSGCSLLLASLFFTFQIYCDFSGYTDIARGSARLLGIRLMENFKSPYYSTSIRQFWSRWHISLSTWFRDYVYIPLGGNRCSKGRKYFNLMVTFLLSGLWHGANWTYVIWGGIHGLGQIVEDMLHLRTPKTKPEQAVRTILVFGFVSFAWIFFRARTFSDAVYVLSHCLEGISSPGNYLHTGMEQLQTRVYELILTGILYLLPLAIYDFNSIHCDVIEAVSSRAKPVRYSIYMLTVLWILFFAASSGVSFVYFQF